MTSDTWQYAGVGPCLFCSGAWGDNVRCMAATVPGHQARARAYRAAAEALADSIEDGRP